MRHCAAAAGRFADEETYDDSRGACNRPANTLAVGQRTFHQKFCCGKIVAIDVNKLDIGSRRWNQKSAG